MSWNIPTGLSSRERRFVRAALWKMGPHPLNGTTGMITSGFLAMVAALGTLNSSSAGMDLALWILCCCLLLVGGLLFAHERRSRMPDALMAINRCGRCGYSLNGSGRAAGQGVDVRTCGECGARWTNLDRRCSIEEVYR